LIGPRDSVEQSTEPPERDLLDRVGDGDETALTVLLAQGRKQLTGYLRFKIPPDLQGFISTEDIIQETHSAVFHRMDAFVPRGADSFDRWVRAVAVRQLRSAVRRQRAAKRGGGRLTLGERSIEDSTVALLDMLGGRIDTPSRCVAQKEAVDAIQRAMKDLPEHYRQAVWLVHIEGRPVQDVADQMGRTDRAVSGLCRRGLKLLKLQLESASKFLSWAD